MQKCYALDWEAENEDVLIVWKRKATKKLCLAGSHTLVSCVRGADVATEPPSPQRQLACSYRTKTNTAAYWCHVGWAVYQNLGDQWKLRHCLGGGKSEWAGLVNKQCASFLSRVHRVLSFHSILHTGNVIFDSKSWAFYCRNIVNSTRVCASFGENPNFAGR